MKMATLTVRNLPEAVHAALRVRAAKNGVSMEAEVRNILTEACLAKPKSATNLQEMVDRLYEGNKPSNVVDDLIRERRIEGAKE
jgi:plasmid stability protein